MVHLPEIIQDLALILAIAGVVTLLFRRIKQPVTLGYILAGFLVSQHVPFLPNVSDIPNVRVWGEIGVIFLLFSLGLEFSFKKLARIGGAASLTGSFEVLSMMGIGFFLGGLLGWSWSDRIFLAAILAISSTTIILRTFDELNVKGRGFVHLVFGVLIFEDLVAVLLLALLSTLVLSQELAGAQLATKVSQLAFFLILWFLAGIFILPTAIRRAKKYMNDETVMIGALALCFVMVVAAVQAGFSAALGAFVMGSILAETTEAERIEKLIKPIKELFAAVFFVSVGMLINPSLLFSHAPMILLITVVFMIGKVSSNFLGALLAGQSPKHAVQAGFSLAQIGEFSFIIAALGESMNVTSDFLYPIAVGVSVLTTFTTPYMVRSSDFVYALLDRHTPERIRNAIVRYSSSARSVSATTEWKTVLRNYFARIIFNSAIIIAIFLSLAHYLLPFLREATGHDGMARSAGLLAALLASAPFFWSLTIGRSSQDQIRSLWRSRRNRAAIMVMEGSRILLALGLFLFLAPRFIALRIAILLVLGVLTIGLIFFSRSLRSIYNWFESRFFENLSERERMASAGLPLVAPWDAHITKLIVPPESQASGQSLEYLKVREHFGVTVAMIERGSRVITAPNRKEMLLPFDRVSVIGTDEQIQAFQSFIQKHLESPHIQHRGNGTENYTLYAYTVYDGSTVVGKTIRECGIREKTHGLVVGLERNGKRILNPDSTTILHVGDLLWIAGDRELLKQL